MRTFSSFEVMKMTGATYKQVNHWACLGYVPGVPREVGSGSKRRWTPDSVLTVRLLQQTSREFLCRPHGGVDLPKLADFVKRAAEAGIYP